jgi:hypothetical protein
MRGTISFCARSLCAAALALIPQSLIFCPPKQRMHSALYYCRSSRTAGFLVHRREVANDRRPHLCCDLDQHLIVVHHDDFDPKGREKRAYHSAASAGWRRGSAAATMGASVSKGVSDVLWIRRASDPTGKAHAGH